jgi:hypothetical protein
MSPSRQPQQMSRNIPVSTASLCPRVAAARGMPHPAHRKDRDSPRAAATRARMTGRLQYWLIMLTPTFSKFVIACRTSDAFSSGTVCVTIVFGDNFRDSTICSIDG